MSFAISPSEYLTQLQESFAEFKAQPLSIGKAMSVVFFANHLSEHVFAAYSSTDLAKLDGCNTLDKYRSHLTSKNANLGIVRDLCDYSKHGPKLDRKSVQVSKTTVKETMVLDSWAFAAGIVSHYAENKIVVSLANGRQYFFDGLIADVVQFWTSLFAAKVL